MTHTGISAKPSKTRGKIDWGRELSSLKLKSMSCQGSRFMRTTSLSFVHYFELISPSDAYDPTSDMFSYSPVKFYLLLSRPRSSIENLFKCDGEVCLLISVWLLGALESFLLRFLWLNCPYISSIAAFVSWSISSPFPQDSDLPRPAMAHHFMLIRIRVELFYDQGNRHEFLSLSQELAAPRELRQSQTFDFNFKNVEKQYKSYRGINVKLRYGLVVLLRSMYWLFSSYFIWVTISRRMADVKQEKEVWVHSFRMLPDSNNSIWMEVGIEDCLHIEFEYNKSKYVLSFALIGLSNRTWSFEGRHRREDILPTRPRQDQTYGTLNRLEGDNWDAAESVQWERNDN